MQSVDVASALVAICITVHFSTHLAYARRIPQSNTREQHARASHNAHASARARWLATRPKAPTDAPERSAIKEVARARARGNPAQRTHKTAKQGTSTPVWPSGLICRHRARRK